MPSGRRSTLLTLVVGQEDLWCEHVLLLVLADVAGVFFWWASVRLLSKHDSGTAAARINSVQYIPKLTAQSHRIKTADS